MSKKLMRRMRAQNILLVFAVSALLLVNLLYWYQFCHSRLFFALFSVLSAAMIILVVYWRVSSQEKSATWFFTILFLMNAALFLFLFTPGSSPDEPYHYWSSYAVSDLMSGQPVDFDANTISARTVDIDLDLNSTTTMSFESLSSTVEDIVLFTGESGLEQTGVPSGSLDFGANPIYIKLPSAVGLLIGRVLGLGAYPTFLLGRVFNFALFAVLALCAIRVTPIAKAGFRVISLMPMTLHVAASYSYDAGIIGLSLLLTAFLLRLFVSDETCGYRDVAAIAVCSALLAPCKVIYVLISFCILFVPKERFATNRMSLVTKCVVVASGLVMIVLMRIPALVSISGVSETGSALDYRGTESGQFYTLGDALSHPFSSALMFLRTMVNLGDFYLSTLIGGSLGWFQENIQAPYYIVFAYLLLVLLSFVRSDGDDAQLGGVVRAAFFAVSLIGWLAIMLSMYLGWTFNTESMVMGVQGRYLIPFLPLLLLSLRSGKLRYAGDLSTSLPLGMTLINVVYLMRIIAISLMS